MEIRELRLGEFRNYASEAVGFAPGLNLILGRNGQGKTNLVEAVNVLCGVGSHRGATGEAMVGWGAERAAASATALVAGREIRIDAEVRRSGGTRLQVNRAPPGRGAGSPLVAVCFAPDDLAVIKGSPEERRRLLDVAAVRLRPLAAADRHEFERVLRQRTGLLKAAPHSSRAASTLDVWDEAFVRAGAVLVRNRLAVLEALRPEVGARYRALAGGVPDVGLEYEASWAEQSLFGLQPGGGGSGGGAVLAPEALDVGVIEKMLTEAVAGARTRDLERGVSTVGPHRDDLKVTLDGADARIYCSQGEQRSLALSLRMAERDLVAASREEDPILLLDDIFSELDDDRREHLVAMVAASGQTIATATSAAGWPLAAQRTLLVDAGRVRVDG